jgi:hypothetical protein
MLVSICILLLAKLEKTPLLLKVANVHSGQETFLNFTFLSQEHLIYAGEHFCILLLAKLEKTPWLLKVANIHSGQENFLKLTFLSQEHLIYAGEHLYPAAGQAGED